MGYTLCVMCYVIGVYGLHTMCNVLCYRCIRATHYVYMCYVIGVYGLHTMCTCAML